MTVATDQNKHSMYTMVLITLAAVWLCRSHEVAAFSSSPFFLPRTRPTSIGMHLVPEGLAGLSSTVHHLSSTYSFCLEQHYLPTQSATGGIFCSIGDIISQNVQGRNDNDDESNNNSKSFAYDPQRTLHYCLKGLGGGIMWACWFDVVDAWSNSLMQQMTPDWSIVDVDDASTGVSSSWTQQALRTAISIALEQFLVCPFFYVFWDIPLPALLRGTPARQVPSQIQNKLGPLLVANAQVWTPVNLVTYNIPVEYRVLFTSCADILWQSINAGITSQEIQVQPPPVPTVTTTSTIRTRTVRKKEPKPAVVSSSATGRDV